MEGPYIAIDLKSFYASVECVDRGMDPLDTNLVVADAARTEKTICLAVSPTLKKRGVSGRPRLFEVVQQVRQLNNLRKMTARKNCFSGKSCLESELMQHPDWEIDYIVATPRMARYLEVSTRIYGIYLRYIAPEDLHVYSIDEVFLDVGPYLSAYGKSAEEFAIELITEVQQEIGITATVGIGENLYLSKVAMDILAKTKEAENGIRMAGLNEYQYRKQLWNHKPITDFWRVGGGLARRLEAMGITTMGELAMMSLVYMDGFYKAFGINAELLIDHAWGWESCKMADIRRYRPKNQSLSSGQILQEPYIHDKARLVVLEMAEELASRMMEHRLLGNQLMLTVGYDKENLKGNKMADYCGPIKMDYRGNRVPKSAHGCRNFSDYSASVALCRRTAGELFDEITNPNLLIRRVGIAMNHICDEKSKVKGKIQPEQLDLFVDYAALEQERYQQQEQEQKEREQQQAILSIKQKFGKSVLFRGTDLLDGATTLQRNRQIGGHKA